MIKPVTAAVMTTVLAFAPMMFMGGMMGKFVFTIPAVVLALLGFSLIESIFFLPAHLEKAPVSRSESRNTVFLNKAKKVYESILRFSLKHRLKTIGGVLIFSLTVLTLSPYLVKFILMHQQDFDIFNVIIETPGGTSLDQDLPGRS